jgi:hypothetical protein
MHSTSSNTSRLTVPASGGGVYLIGANVTLKTTDLAGSDYYHGLRLLVNGASIVAQTGPTQTVADSYDLALQVQALNALSATDYVEVQVFTDAPDLLVMVAASYSPEFWAIWQRV